MKYAKVIIDISAEQVDRAFTYRIPGELSERIVPGVRVQVPFGSANKAKTGFVIGLSDEAEFDESRIKPILSLLPKALDTNADLIGLAAFMAAEYGCKVVLNAAPPAPFSDEAFRKADITVFNETEALYSLTMLMSAECTDLCRIIEGLRYGLPPEEIERNLTIM